MEGKGPYSISSISTLLQHVDSNGRANRGLGRDSSKFIASFSFSYNCMCQKREAPESLGEDHLEDSEEREREGVKVEEG